MHSNSEYLKIVLALFNKSKHGDIIGTTKNNNNVFSTNVLVYVCYIYNLLPLSMMNEIEYSSFVNALGFEIIDINKSNDIDSIEITAECCQFIDKLVKFTQLEKVAHSKDKLNYYRNYIGYLLLTDSKFKAHEVLTKSIKGVSYGHIVSTIKVQLSNIYDLPVNATLNKYGQFLTDPFAETDMLNCYGRDGEINQLIDILSRKTKNCPLVVGQPGVGKTAVVQGLANLLMSEKCPKQFVGYHIYELSLTSLVSGAIYRGDLESRLTDVLKIVTEEYDNIIVFMDEIHSIMNTSNDNAGTQGVSTADVLKPYMCGGKLKLIGATTESEYHIIEKDSAIGRRFNVLHIKEPSVLAVISLLNNVVGEYEQHFDISCESSILPIIVDYANKYITNRYMPDKVLDLLDTSFVQCKNHSDRHDLCIDDVIHATEILSGITVPVADNSVITKVNETMQELKENVIGQNEALKDIETALKRYFLGLSVQTKPIASFLFVGPTGVGKTAMCKTLANSLFNKESFIKLDMSEYMEKHAVSKLIGAPPGYVGYSKGGKLTERVKHNPFSVILFDEIEKAHTDIYNILLQILDDGALTDSEGCRVDFTNTIIVLTSNVGATDVRDKSKNIVGFGDNTLSNKDAMKIYENAVKKQFSPEFINRLDKVVYFNTLSKEDISQIVDKELNKLCIKLEAINVKLDIENDVRQYLYDKCFLPEYGARYAQRIVISDIEDKITDYLMINNLINIKCHLVFSKLADGFDIKSTVKELVK